MLNILHKHRFCFIAGVFAALGSFFAKLPNFYHQKQSKATSTNSGVNIFVFYYIFAYGLMILSNILNWRFYLKALNASQQTLTTTVLTVATNYLVTFFLVVIVCGEIMSFLTAIGIILMLVGLHIILTAQQHENKLKLK